ncbi:MAG: hypothetical protein HY282_11270 [Nitrospirae bacterium]|nr:hypothetical protein [Candidatus Manganitrophaceae bacterium]
MLSLITTRRLTSFSLFLSISLLLSGCGGGGGESGSGIAVVITPATATLHPDETQQFAATVSGTGNPGITWQIQEGATAGVVDANGLYTAPTTPGTYHVVAFSQADASKSASSVVTVIHSVGSVSGAPGTLDSTFGTGGKVITPVGFGSDSAVGVVVQQDGKVIVAGNTFNGANSDFLLLRYNPDGTLDTSFGTKGKVLIDFGLGDTARALALDSIGRIVVAGSAFNGTKYDFAVARYTTQGTPDTSFGVNGKAITQIGSGDDVASALAIRSDNFILVVGSSYNGNNTDYALVLYNDSGLLDTTFGSGGKVTTAIGNGDDFPFAIGLQSDGRIIVAGDTYNGQDYDFAMVRYTAIGAVDHSSPTFGINGKVVSQIGTSHEAIRAMAIQNSTVVVAGFVYNTTDPDVALVRYNLSDGSFDTTFGNQGKVITPIGSGDDLALSIQIQSDSKILIAGNAFNGVDADFFLARYSPNGNLDSTFGAGGKVTTDFGAGDDIARALVLLSGGKILAAGESLSKNNKDLALARYNSDGTLDLSFNTTGKQTVDSEVASAIADTLAVQSDGKIIAAGDSFDGENFRFSLVRYRTDGQIDSAFGEEGKVATIFDGGTGGKIVIRPDGKILAGGTIFENGDYDFGIVLYDTNGAFERFSPIGFGPGGGANQDYLDAMVLQPNGSILVAGQTWVGSNYDFALARVDTDGNLDPTFGTGGKVITAISQGNDFVTSIALQPDGKIILSGYSVVGSTNNLVLARYNTDGSLDSAFSGGIISTTFAPGASSAATAVRIQPDGRIVIGGYSVTSDNYDVALARYNTDGSLDSTFGTGGKVVTALDTGNDGLFDMALQADGKIVVAGFSNVTGADFAVARYKSDGTLDPSFGQGGKRIVSAGQSIDFAYAVALQADGKIIAAGGSQEGSHYDFALIRLLP